MVAYLLVSQISSRVARKPIDSREASSQTAKIEVVKLIKNSRSTQTDFMSQTDVALDTYPIEQCSVGIQVSLCDEDQPAESKYSILPETPSTCNGSLLPADTVVARTTSVVSSSEDSDMEMLLQSAMMSMMTPPTASENENSLFGRGGVEWGVVDDVSGRSPCCNLDRFTTSDTFISGGSIYRTCSEPVPDTITPSGNYWYMGSSDTIGSPLNGVGEDEELVDGTSLYTGGYNPAAGMMMSSSVASMNFESQVVERFRPSNEFQMKAARMITRLSQSVVAWFGTSEASLIPYGSIASGLALENASVDLTLMIPQEILEKWFGSSSSISSPRGGSFEADHIETIPLHQRREYETRVMMKRALMKMVEVWREEQRLTVVQTTGVGGSVSANFSILKLPSVSAIVENIRFEITCNNLYPMFSTRLAKCYNGLSPNGRVRDLILAVKAWHPHGGGFMLTLMALFYCQVSKNLFPSLQALSAERKQWKDPFGSRRCDVSFVESVEGLALVDDESTLSLFVGFVQFYANYWNWYSGVVSVRLGKIVNIDSPEILLRRCPVASGGHLVLAPPTHHHHAEKLRVLHVEDPFDSKRDIGILSSVHATELYKHFQKTYLQSPSSLASSSCFRQQ